jgi:tRNA dimethylallyltransferase
MSGLGYKQIGLYLQEKIDLSSAIQQIKFDTHSFARHQYNWFRLKDKRINWFELGKGSNQAIHRFVQRFVVK